MLCLCVCVRDHLFVLVIPLQFQLFHVRHSSCDCLRIETGRGGDGCDVCSPHGKTLGKYKAGILFAFGLAVEIRFVPLQAEVDGSVFTTVYMHCLCKLRHTLISPI